MLFVRDSGFALMRAPRNDGHQSIQFRKLIPAVALDARIGVDDTAIDRDGDADHVVSRARGEIDRGPRHVLIGTDPTRRHALRHLIGVITRRLVHVGLERSRRNRRHHDVIADQLHRHSPRQVNQARFARGVGIGFHRIDEDAVDRGDVDDLGGLLHGGGRAQRCGERFRQEER